MYLDYALIIMDTIHLYTIGSKEDKKICIYCKKELQRKIYKLAGKERLGKFKKRNFCSNKCKSDYHSSITSLVRNEKGQKKCNICLIWKNECDFYINKKNKDLLLGKCKVCSIIKNRENLKKNNILIKKKSRIKYRENNNFRDNMLKYQKKYRFINKEKTLKYAKEYRNINKEKIKLYKKTEKGNILCRQIDFLRRTKIKERITYEQWEKIFYKFGKQCLNCGTKENITIDHIIPLSIGGRNILENIQILCKSCNSKKYTKIIDYRTKNGK